MRITHGRKVLAAAVHVFTATGALCGLMATLAVAGGAYEAAFGWLFVALVVDAVDGTFARRVGVVMVLPRFSGERLDLVIDYLNYVFVPVLALLHAGILSGWSGVLLAGGVLMSSLYHFADLESKADDNCFVGFPAVWNLVAFCLFAWDLHGWGAGLVVGCLVALTFVPMRWLHPMRVKRLFVLNVAVMLAGLAAGLWILWSGFPGSLVASSCVAAAAAYFVGLAFFWSWLGERSSGL